MRYFKVFDGEDFTVYDADDEDSAEYLLDQVKSAKENLIIEPLMELEYKILQRNCPICEDNK